MQEKAILAIDVGKSKILAGFYDQDLNLLDRHRIVVVSRAQSVDDLMKKVTEAGRFSISRIGVSLFGPLVTDRTAEDFGAIVGSSMPQWSGLNLPQLLASAFGVSVYFAYDVVAGALFQGAANGDATPYVYLSVGTGIGGTTFSPGVSDPRTDPPQLGHMLVPREPGDSFPGACRFHGDCLQGLASGRAIYERWGIHAVNLAVDHEAWSLEATYLARACANIFYSYSFMPIYIGSGIAAVPRLLEKVAACTENFVNGFPASDMKRLSMVHLIGGAARLPDSSLYGAAALAHERSGHVLRR